MKRAAYVVGALACLLVAPQFTHARDDKYILPIEAALQSSVPAEKSDGAVKFSSPGRRPRGS
jgi:hypothetical protein